jgi:hypothetical protein
MDLRIDVSAQDAAERPNHVYIELASAIDKNTLVGIVEREPQAAVLVEVGVAAVEAAGVVELAAQPVDAAVIVGGATAVALPRRPGDTGWRAHTPVHQSSCRTNGSPA